MWKVRHCSDSRKLIGNYFNLMSVHSLHNFGERTYTRNSCLNSCGDWDLMGNNTANFSLARHPVMGICSSYQHAKFCSRELMLILARIPMMAWFASLLTIKSAFLRYYWRKLPSKMPGGKKFPYTLTKYTKKQQIQNFLNGVFVCLLRANIVANQAKGDICNNPSTIPCSGSLMI